MHSLHPRPWHGGSIYGPGPRRALSFSQREQYGRLLDQAAAERLISPMAERVGRKLLALLGRDGRLDPSYATIAKAVGCCEKTARTAVAALEAAGLLRKVRRLVRAGWRAVQTSNAYQLLLPAAAYVGALARSVAADRLVQQQSRIKKRCFTATVTVEAEPPDEEVRGGALARLGTLLGVPAQAVMPWLAS